MDDERLERLLKGYAIPETSRALDQRVMQDATRILERAQTRETAAHYGRQILDQLGFGYLGWLLDFVTKTDAEYSVELI